MCSDSRQYNENNAVAVRSDPGLPRPNVFPCSVFVGVHQFCIACCKTCWQCATPFEARLIWVCLNELLKKGRSAKIIWQKRITFICS